MLLLLQRIGAGSRIGHIFYHLARDYQVYRFSCRYDDCSEQHYKKDQLQVHQKRSHGRTDPSLIDDKYTQLYDTVYELYESLLGIKLVNAVIPTERQIKLDHQQPPRSALVHKQQQQQPESTDDDDNVDDDEEDGDDDESTKRGAAPNIMNCRLCDRPCNCKVCCHQS